MEDIGYALPNLLKQYFCDVFIWMSFGRDVLLQKKNDVDLSYRSNINGPGTPRPLNRPKVSLSAPLTTNGLPESTDSRESNSPHNEEKNHRCVCSIFRNRKVSSSDVDIHWRFSGPICHSQCTVSFPHLWAPHLCIQPTKDQECLGK